MKLHSTLATVLALALPMAAIPSARAEFIAEYFSGYGAGVLTLSGRGSAGGGWAGAWGGSDQPEYAGPTPPSGVGGSLVFNNLAYDNSPNLAGPTDGTSRKKQGGTGAQAGSISTRVFSTGMAGTIWVSAIAIAFGANNEALLWLDADGINNPNDYIAIRKQTVPEPAMRVNGADSTSNDENFQAVICLLIARIVIDADGANDHLDFWAKVTVHGVFLLTDPPAACGTV